MIARRAADIQRHESTLRDLIADYFHFQERADAVRAEADSTAARLRREADARVARVQERAGQEAAGFEEQARAAVRRMLEFGEDRRAVAEATGMTLSQIREVQRHAPAPVDRADTAEITLPAP